MTTADEVLDVARRARTAAAQLAPMTRAAKDAALLAMADARVVARLADATLLCVRWRDTPRSVVRNSLGLLEEAHARVVGAALTHTAADWVAISNPKALRT